MTTEEKAKAYDKALEQAKKELNTCGSLDCDAARQIFRFFPQLCESEDERIRKGLIEALKTSKTVGELKFTLPEPTREKCIAYLEKQKEQKPAEWSEEDKQILHSFEVICQRLIENPHGEKFEVERSYAKKMLSWLKSLHLQYHGDVTMTEAYKMGLEAGKISSWKPNEHQMTILKAVKEYVGRGSGYWGEALGSLIEDLEKLM